MGSSPLVAGEPFAQILHHVPAPAFDYAYHWESQNGDTALQNSPALLQIFLSHNSAAGSPGSAITPPPIDTQPPATGQGSPGGGSSTGSPVSTTNGAANGSSPTGDSHNDLVHSIVGQTMSADDVIYSIQRLTDPKTKLFGGAALASVDVANLKKMDDRTVQIPLKQADSTIPDAFAQYIAGIVPVGYDSKGKSLKDGQIGTGAYTLESFTPGQQSVHKKFANYWRTGYAFFDQVTVINLDDAKARVNALISGQVDAIADIPFAQTKIVEANSAMKLLNSQGGGWLPLCMAIDQDPFTDVRVRQAFRLIVDREAMVKQVLAGYGRVANDLYGPFDAAYPTDIPQRVKDIEKAKQLLQEAGKSGMSIDLQTTDGAVGMVDIAKVFAEQAKEAGVTVNVKVLDGATFYGDQYLKWTFSTDFWGTRNYLNQVAAGSLPTSPYNETHWPPKDSNFIANYNKALAEPDVEARKPIIHEMMQLEYDQGGYIIPFFGNLVDAYSSKVTGFQDNKSTLNLDTFGRGYREIWFA